MSGNMEGIMKKEKRTFVGAYPTMTSYSEEAAIAQKQAQTFVAEITNNPSK